MPQLIRVLRFLFKPGICAAVALSLLPAALFMLFSPRTTLPVSRGSGYATVVLDERADEADALSRLEARGIKNVRAASRERAYLNDFQAIIEVPLDSYFERVESYDPRNDGYAEKARAIFISGGKRRLFIPLSELSAFGGAPARDTVAGALRGFDWSLVFQSYRRSSLPTLIVFALSSVMLILLAKKIAYLSADRFLPAYALGFLPSFALFAWEGGGALAAAAALLALFQLLRAPLQRFLTGLRFESGAPAEPDSLSFLFRGKQFSLFLAELAPEAKTITALAVLYFLICAAARLSPGEALFALCAFCLAFTACAAAESLRGRLKTHVRFIFVPIRSSYYGAKKFPTLPLPFLAAALGVLALEFLFPARAVESVPLDFGGKDALSLRAEDFERHLAVQRAFPYRKLGSSAEDAGAYVRYPLGANSLIAPEEERGEPQLDVQSPADQIDAQWTLAPLIASLQGVSGGQKASGAGARGAALAALLAFSLYIPFILSRAALRRKWYAHGAAHGGIAWRLLL
jgi:hypothetical protein